MNGTKAIWCVALLLLCAAVALALLPESGDPGTPGGRAPRTARETTATAAPVAPVTSVTPPVAHAGAPGSAATSDTPEFVPASQGKSPGESPAVASVTPPAPVKRSPDAVSLGMDQVIPHATVLAGDIVPQRDAATNEEFLLADGRFEIRGKGTFDEPYRVSWECLASASKTYVPRLRETGIPQRIALLNGKWLRIEGFLAFPLMVSESKDLLVVLNQWDGCCIGIPPTCYDAIEVKLLEPARRSGAHALFNYGSVQGKLRVDPYLVENFLSGLYVLDDAFMVKDYKPEL